MVAIIIVLFIINDDDRSTLCSAASHLLYILPNFINRPTVAAPNI